jgi:hypothetical protein
MGRDFLAFIKAISLLLLRFFSVWPIIWRCERESERFPNNEMSLGIADAKSWALIELLPIPRTLMAIVYIIVMERTHAKIQRYWPDDYGYVGATAGDVSVMVVFSLPLYLATDFAFYQLLTCWAGI